MTVIPSIAFALVVCSLAGCASELAPSAFDDGMPQMRPEIFFAGTTSSTGVMENRSGAPTRRFRVQGNGNVLEDGRFRLVQSVAFDGETPQQRTWVMRQLDAHHYTATLTDASGPVEAEAYGNLFHLRYPMTNPAGGQMEQWLYLQPDGRTVVNEATVRVLGVVAVRMSERITREEN